MKPAMRVGLTGGIGSGKSAVKDLFDALGAPTIDADELARGMTRPGEAAFDEVVARFGPECVNQTGELRRDYLRDLIFNDPALKADLERIIHPRVVAAIHDFAQGVEYPYCVTCIPLLLETGAEIDVDRVLVVDAPEALRVQRVMQRDQVTAQQVKQIIRAQVGQTQRLRAADDVIVNDSNTTNLEAEVKRLHRLYLAA